ncbi:MAG: hypothetical protein ACYC33_07765 [Thermoleophilia bacterium]
MTVMFAELSGFTALSEQVDPEHVRDLVNACLDLLAPIQVAGPASLAPAWEGVEVVITTANSALRGGR